MRFLKLDYNYPYLEALKEIESNTDIWNVFTLRQNIPNSPHKQTKCIPLRGPELKPRINLEEVIENYDTNLSDSFPFIVNSVNTLFNHFPECELGRVMLVSLDPGGHIDRHSDSGKYAEYYRRIHIPIKSLEGNIFISEDESIHMEPGGVYMFNHLIDHEVFNNSNEERIHLIIDFRIKEVT